MDTVDDELWNIYTFYSLHGNPRDPSKLQCSQFLKLCRDCLVMDHKMVDRPLTQADIQLIYTYELRKAGKKSYNPHSERLDYDQFLCCLIRVAEKAYPRAGGPEHAMEQLLMDNVLPLASRRKPILAEALLTQPAVEALYEYYEDALKAFYRFYTTSSEVKGRTMVQSLGSSVRTFDDHREEANRSRETAAASSAADGASPSKSGGQLSYADFLRFASDFGLTSSMALTALDLGDIYMTVISSQNFTTALRSLTLKEFWEALVRCALVAFRMNVKISTEDKLKAMFLFIWRHVQETMQEQLSGHNSKEKKNIFSSSKGGLLKGSKILNDKFITAWTKDGFKDYLVHQSDVILPPPPLDGSKLLGLVKSNSFSRGASFASEGGHLGNGAASDDESENPFRDVDETEEGGEVIPNHKPAFSTPSTPSAASATAIGSGGGASKDPQVAILIEDGDDLGDHRIEASKLRKLLMNRPDLTALLLSCIEEEGLRGFKPLDTFNVE